VLTFNLPLWNVELCARYIQRIFISEGPVWGALSYEAFQYASGIIWEHDSLSSSLTCPRLDRLSFNKPALSPKEILTSVSKGDITQAERGLASLLQVHRG